jgi:UDP-glucose 4-epimerase
LRWIEAFFDDDHPAHRRQWLHRVAHLAGLQSAGFDVVGVDDFSNSSPGVLDRLRELGGREVVFERASVCDAAAMDALFERHRIDAVVHFAALKAVGESTHNRWTTTRTTSAAC